MKTRLRFFMRIMTLLFFLFISLFVAAETTLEDGLQAGIRLYQEENYEQASEKFKLAYGAKAETPALLFNWGLAAYKQQQKGLALALWRRALFLDPELSP